ncbi:Scn11a [Symbiodinium pilosum]|uniref:Scn11a protein n=1 Tax=Symbiodinium pilosum TaxID=2952 RepID=A0A812TB40_SYMPI|nr:Scn11a [Symbiodinium pilosum]
MACLHRAGYIHGDLKADNMFYKGLDKNGCPAGVVLADFGLSQPLNSQMPTFEAKYYPGSFHLVDSLFSGKPDTPKIRMPGRKDVVRASEVIDRCSLLLFAYANFGTEVIGPGKPIRQGGCGRMGVNRPYLLPTHSIFPED